MQVFFVIPPNDPEPKTKSQRQRQEQAFYDDVGNEPMLGVFRHLQKRVTRSWRLVRLYWKRSRLNRKPLGQISTR